MSERTVLLTDVDSGVWLDAYRLTEEPDLTLRGSSGWSITKRTLRGGSADRVDVVEIDNGHLAVTVLPTRGMGLWRGTCAGIPLGWRSPVERPVHPSRVPLTERGGLGWLHGFNEWLCRCGLAWNGPPGNDGGTPLTLHGRIANCSAHRLEVRVTTDGPGTLAVRGVVDETTVFGPRLRLESTLSTDAGSNRLRIVDRVTNLAGQPGEMQLLYHLNTGRPFLEEGARFSAPLREVAPRDARAAEGIADWSTYCGPTPGSAEQVYYAEPLADDAGNTLALLRNAAGDRGLSVHWNVGALPCFALWKCTQAEADGYVTGLEPATNYPNLKPFERERGRVVPLAPGESFEARLEIAIHTTPQQVASAEQWIEALQRGTPPRIHTSPQKRLSPG